MKVGVLSIVNMTGNTISVVMNDSARNGKKHKIEAFLYSQENKEYAETDESPVDEGQGDVIKPNAVSFIRDIDPGDEVRNRFGNGDNEILINLPSLGRDVYKTCKFNVPISEYPVKDNLILVVTRTGADLYVHGGKNIKSVNLVTSKDAAAA